jgi:hypothetical protein
MAVLGHPAAARPTQVRASACAGLAERHAEGPAGLMQLDNAETTFRRADMAVPSASRARSVSGGLGHAGLPDCGAVIGVAACGPPLRVGRIFAVLGLFALWGGGQTSAQALGVEVELVSITSPVHVGEPVTLLIHTVGAAYCGIDNRDRLGPGKWRGLMPQQADERGQVRWTWPVDGTRTPPGTWVIRVTCAVGGRQGALEASLVVR